MPNTIPADIPHLFIQTHTQRILRSYKKWTGRDLLSFDSHLRSSAGADSLAETLFYAPFVVVTSDNSEDPLLTYGNAQGLALWELSWNQLVKTPGRHTAEPMHRDERQTFLDTVRKNGFIDNYSGIRISSSGKRFRIEKATVWNLVDEQDQFIGQAATFNTWHYL